MPCEKKQRVPVIDNGKHIHVVVAQPAYSLTFFRAHLFEVSVLGMAGLFPTHNNMQSFKYALSAPARLNPDAMISLALRRLLFDPDA